jgi:hypothetical protein
MLRSVAPRSTERVSTICEGFGSTQHSEQGVHNIQGNAGMATPREHRRIGAQHVGRPNRHRLGTVAPCPPPPVNRCSPTWNGSRTLRLIALPWRRGSRGSPGSPCGTTSARLGEPTLASWGSIFRSGDYYAVGKSEHRVARHQGQCCNWEMNGLLARIYPEILLPWAIFGC